MNDFYYNETANEYWIYSGNDFYDDVKIHTYPRWRQSDVVKLIKDYKLIDYILTVKIPCSINNMKRPSKVVEKRFV